MFCLLLPGCCITAITSEWFKDELKTYGQQAWSGTVCILPFVLSIAMPLLLARFEPDVPSWFGFLAFLGAGWIYIVQFHLYQEINRLYANEGLKPPLVMW
ncbi:MAG: hypothetical protein WBB01_15610 [Phormidesmis sp.]